jgi:hypothetical protein
MKKVFASSLNRLLVLILICTHNPKIIWAQGLEKTSLKSESTVAKQNRIIFNGILSHYIRDKTDELSISDVGTYMINPGCEALHLFGNKKLKYLTGLSYQYGQLSSIKDGYYRFYFSEASIPLILQLEKSLPNNKMLFFSGGIYSGGLLHCKWLNAISAGWEERNYKNLRHYSKNDWFFTDLYCDFGYKYHTPPTDNQLSCSVFFKYRIKDNWFGYYKAAPYFGIKIGYVINL